MKVTIVFEAMYHNLRDIDEVCNNFYQGYPKWAANLEEIEFTKSKGKMFKLVWEGELDNLEEHEIDELIRLTHHAEGFYECTNVEFVHVEVCLDGKWYGKE